VKKHQSATFVAKDSGFNRSSMSAIENS